jgi:CRISPR-associated protein Csb2
MPLILEQTFPLGRFHATRWNQNPFEDRHGEWPPSPWRLLRALAARWFQYARETGNEDEPRRDQLLAKLAESPPVFRLPEMTWRGPEMRQYQPTALDEQYKYRKDPMTKKPVIDYSFKAISKTLSVDCPRVISPTDSVFWIWDNVVLDDRSKQLLEALLRRVLYFGRAESFCRIRIASCEPAISFRCELSPSEQSGSPVLVATPGDKLNLESLLASSDDKLFKGRQIPPGTEWQYAHLPPCPTVMNPPRRKSKFPHDLQVIQFAVGGRVFPEQAHWVRVIEKFRGSVLKHAARIVSGGTCSSYRQLRPNLRDKLTLLSGKDGNGKPVQNHQHAYFFLCPDELGNPTRLIVHRRAAFDATADQPFEVEAILAASRQPIFWQSRDPEWSLRLVPLPFETPPPLSCSMHDVKSKVWISATPFVPPNRHRFREYGRLRAAETASSLLKKTLSETLLAIGSTVSVVGIESIDHDDNVIATRPNEDPSEFTWVTIHETLSDRRRRLKDRTRRVRPGFRFRVEFAEPIHGPLLVGHSCHFGLGLFSAVRT